MEATFKQLASQLEDDLKILTEKFSASKDQDAIEAAKDAKFLRERQANL